MCYRSYKNYDESLLFNDLEIFFFLTNHTYPNENYQYVTTDTFLTVTEKHALLKKKIVRGNQKW